MTPQLWGELIGMIVALGGAVTAWLHSKAASQHAADAGKSAQSAAASASGAAPPPPPGTVT